METNNITNDIPDIEVLFDLADLFKVFGDSTRLRIMYILSSGELSVLAIAEGLGMEQSTISHQLRVLRQNKLVRVRRDGKQIDHRDGSGARFGVSLWNNVYMCWKISTALTARVKSKGLSPKPRATTA